MYHEFFFYWKKKLLFTLKILFFCVNVAGITCCEINLTTFATFSSRDNLFSDQLPYLNPATCDFFENVCFSYFLLRDKNISIQNVSTTLFCNFHLPLC